LPVSVGGLTFDGDIFVDALLGFTPMPIKAPPAAIPDTNRRLEIIALSQKVKLLVFMLALLAYLLMIRLVSLSILYKTNIVEKKALVN